MPSNAGEAVGSHPLRPPLRRREGRRTPVLRFRLVDRCRLGLSGGAVWVGVAAPRQRIRWPQPRPLHGGVSGGVRRLEALSSRRVPAGFVCLGGVGEAVVATPSLTFVLRLHHRHGGARSGAPEKLRDSVQEYGRPVLRGLTVPSVDRRRLLFRSKVGGLEVADPVVSPDGVGGARRIWSPRCTGMSPGRRPTSTTVPPAAGLFFDSKSRWSAMVHLRFWLRGRPVFLLPGVRPGGAGGWRRATVLRSLGTPRGLVVFLFFLGSFLLLFLDRCPLSMFLVVSAWVCACALSFA